MKTISSSCYDAIVIKQQNRTYRSTPFQVVFSSNFIKQIERNVGKNKTQPYKLSLTVNNKLVDIPSKIDENGRVVFELVIFILCRNISKKCLIWFLTLQIFQMRIIRINLQILLTLKSPRIRVCKRSFKNIKTSKLQVNSGNLLGFLIIKKIRILLQIFIKYRMTRIIPQI